MDPLTELLERQSVLVMEATIPAEMTIADWRRSRARRTARPRRIARRWRHDRGGLR
jgi:hypothetical protein